MRRGESKVSKPVTRAPRHTLETFGRVAPARTGDAWIRAPLAQNFDQLRTRREKQRQLTMYRETRERGRQTDRQTDRQRKEPTRLTRQTQLPPSTTPSPLCHPRHMNRRPGLAAPNPQREHLLRPKSSRARPAFLRLYLCTALSKLRR